MAASSITVTLDEDVLEHLKRKSEMQGISLDRTVNELLREGLSTTEAASKRRNLQIKPHRGGYYPDLNYDCTEALLEHSEGVFHR